MVRLHQRNGVFFSRSLCQVLTAIGKQCRSIMCCAHIISVSQTFRVFAVLRAASSRYESQTRESRHTLGVKDPVESMKPSVVNNPDWELQKWALIRKKKQHPCAAPRLDITFARFCQSKRNSSLGSISTLARYLLMSMCLLDDLPYPTTYIQLHHIAHCRLVGF